MIGIEDDDRVVPNSCVIDGLDQLAHEVIGVAHHRFVPLELGFREGLVRRGDQRAVSQGKRIVEQHGAVAVAPDEID